MGQQQLAAASPPKAPCHVGRIYNPPVAPSVLKDRPLTSGGMKMEYLTYNGAVERYR